MQLKAVAVKSMQGLDGYKGIFGAVVKDMMTLANKSNAGLQHLLVDCLASTSLLRSTGMRSITGIFLQKSAFEETDEGVMLKRMERKCANVRNVVKPVHVMLVPDKDPALCTLLHLAPHFKSRGDNTPLFTAGHTLKPFLAVELGDLLADGGYVPTTRFPKHATIGCKGARYDCSSTAVCSSPSTRR